MGQTRRKNIDCEVVFEDALVLLLENFWGHELACPCPHVLRGRSDEVAHPEIDDFELVVWGQNQVLGLDVSMHYAQLLQILEPAVKASHGFEPFRPLEAPELYDLGECDSRHIFSDYGEFVLSFL